MATPAVGPLGGCDGNLLARRQHRRAPGHVPGRVDAGAAGVAQVVDLDARPRIGAALTT
ncbi:MAG: hypothetical protein ACRD0A_02875 [Acidimicrobiales bacterium]